MICIVPGPPQGKARPRVTTAGGKAHAYTPRQTADYEWLIRACYTGQGGRMISGPVRLSVRAFFPVPGSASRITRAAMLAGNIRPEKKPDADNILKIVMDALNGAAYADDKQVTLAACGKAYGAEARLEIEIEAEEDNGNDRA